MTRLQFFIGHIGKRIFRTRNGCKAHNGKNCSICEHVYQNGLIVEDSIHASYLESIEAETNITYYGSIGERNDSENIIPDNQTNQSLKTGRTSQFIKYNKPYNYGRIKGRATDHI